MAEENKSPGQLAYEITYRADVPGMDDASLSLLWSTRLTANARSHWESIASQISAPLLKRIEELEAEVKTIAQKAIADFCRDNSLRYACTQCFEEIEEGVNCLKCYPIIVTN